MKITERDSGQGYHLITLENKNKLALSISDLGARIVNSKSNGRELVLGLDTAEEYIEEDPHIGASTGHTAGRIENDRFPLSGKTYQLITDPKAEHNLHGGVPGPELEKWSYVILNGENEASVVFAATSPDGEHGFPDTMDVETRYALTQDNIWRVTSRGTSDQDTLFNLTNHVYFNLTGDASQSIGQHELWLNSEAYAPSRTDGIPIGVKENTTGSAFDFQIPERLTSVSASDLDQENLIDGIDRPFFLKETGLDKEAAHLISPDKGIQVDIATDASSVVIFTANLGTEAPEMRNQKLAHHGSITFETQTAPGAERFSVLGLIHSKAESIFETVTEFRIKTRKG